MLNKKCSINICVMIYSVQFSYSVVSDSLQPHGLQHTRPLCPSPTPGVCSNSFCGWGNWGWIKFNDISLVQSFSHVWLFVTPWSAACQASLCITNSWSLLKLMSIESVMPSNHFILCRPLLLLPSVIPSIRIFSNESVLCIRWPKYTNT